MPSSFFDNPGLFRTAMEELPVGIYIVDREQRIRFWNRGAEGIIGHLAHEVVGRMCSEYIACDQQGHTLCGNDCPVTATLRDGQRQSISAFYLHKLGHRVPVHIRTQAIVRYCRADRNRLLCGRCVPTAFPNARSRGDRGLRRSCACSCPALL